MNYPFLRRQKWVTKTNSWTVFWINIRFERQYQICNDWEYTSNAVSRFSMCVSKIIGSSRKVLMWHQCEDRNCSHWALRTMFAESSNVGSTTLTSSAKTTSLKWGIFFLSIFNLVAMCAYFPFGSSLPFGFGWFCFIWKNQIIELRVQEVDNRRAFFDHKKKDWFT